MYAILLMLILILVLIVKGFFENDKSKTISLVSSVGLFALVWGLLGQTVGLVSAFDAIEAAGDISISLMAGGFKVSLLTTIFGFLTFLVSRLGVIILVWINKDGQS